MPARVMNRVDLPGEAGSIILYDYMAKEVEDGRNLVRVDAEGESLWKATPPMGKQDCFVHIEWDGRSLFANTWSSYRVSVDPETGDVAVLHFTK